VFFFFFLMLQGVFVFWVFMIHFYTIIFHLKTESQYLIQINLTFLKTKMIQTETNENNIQLNAASGLCLLGYYDTFLYYNCPYNDRKSVFTSNRCDFSEHANSSVNDNICNVVIYLSSFKVGLSVAELFRRIGKNVAQSVDGMKDGVVEPDTLKTRFETTKSATPTSTSPVKSF